MDDGMADRADARWSFVAADLPFRHGLTLGEIGLVYVRRTPELAACPPDLYRVVRVRGLRRDLAADVLVSGVCGDAALWPAFPSPNMPTLPAMYAFASFVMLEACANVSEGRGTTAPFSMFGAPFVDPAGMLAFLRRWDDALEAAAAALPLEDSADADRLRAMRWAAFLQLVPCEFRPTFNKAAGLRCRGLRLLATSLEALDTVHRFALGVAVLTYLCVAHPAELAWRSAAQGYEYNFSLPARDLILGSARWTAYFERDWSRVDDEAALFAELRALLLWAQRGAERFAEEAAPFFLYE